MRLAIVSHSARIYSQMAQREGFTVLAVDAFLDADTRLAADSVHHWPVMLDQPLDQAMSDLTPVLDAFEPDAVLVGSGFEAHSAAYAALFEGYPVLGNAPQTIVNVKNPQWLKATCEAQNVQSPAISLTPPTGGDWLTKQLGQCGGSHVQRWQAQSIQDASAYWQQYQPGQAVGILFLAQADAYTLIGVHALHQHADSYAYAGASRLQDAALISAAHHLLAALLPALGLVGINSMDAVWDTQTLHLLEVNPRLSASMRLYMQQPLIQAHLNACDQQALPALKPPAMLASHRILYARQTIDARQLSLPDWLEDRPAGGHIAAGQPVCSLYAEGHTTREVEQTLRDKKTQLHKLWGTYVCEHIEFNIH